jgi:DNA-binding protein YbaB
VDNDQLRHDFTEVLALVQEQMREQSAVQHKRSALVAKAAAADGAVEVSVNAQRVVTAVVIDESYLDDFEFADLGGHIVEAARAAAGEIERRAAALLAPLAERRRAISALADIVVDAPDFGNAISALTSSATALDRRPSNDGGGGPEEHPPYRTVRR